MDPVLCGLLVGWVWMVLMWSCYIVVHRHLARNHCHTCCLFLNPHPTSSFLFSHFPFPVLSFAFFLSSIFAKVSLLLSFSFSLRMSENTFPNSVACQHDLISPNASVSCLGVVVKRIWLKLVCGSHFIAFLKIVFLAPSLSLAQE